jgi:hypothetical protein
MDYLTIISKLIFSSLLAILVIAIVYLSFSVTKRLFGKQKLSYATSTLTLLILVSISFLISDRWLNNLQLELIDYFVPERIISELIISILMVVSFTGTQVLLKEGIRLFNSFRTPSFSRLLTQWDLEKVSDERVKEEQALLSLQKWIKRKDETGWYELKEIFEEHQIITSRQATNLISGELQDLQYIKNSNASLIQKRNHKYEEKLNWLLPRFAVTSDANNR